MNAAPGPAATSDFPGVPGNCGTPAGAQRHRRRGEPICQACRDATAEAMRNFRNRRGAGYDKWWNSTYAAAQRLLAAEYPARFAELLAEVRRERPTPWDSGEAS